MADQKKQVNVDFSNFPELLDGLDQMGQEDDTDRSKFIPKLVKQEKARREATKLTPTQKKTTAASARQVDLVP